MHLDRTWPAFPHEKQMCEFDRGGEDEFGRTPWRKKGGTREFPPEDGKTAEFLEMESTDEDDEIVHVNSWKQNLQIGYEAVAAEFVRSPSPRFQPL